MEGARHKGILLNYMMHTHAVAEGVHPLFMWTYCFDMFCDRNRGTTVHEQWCQPVGTVFADGMYVKAFDLLRMCEGS
jgi:hypothetical protein